MNHYKLGIEDDFKNFHQRWEAGNHKNKFAPFCELDAKSDYFDAWCAHIVMLAQFSHFQLDF